MTCRVFDVERQTLPRVDRLDPRPTDSSSPAAKSLAAAALTAVVVVPLAGLAQPPASWIGAGAAAMMVLFLVATLGGRAHWGWLAALVGAAGLVVPRGRFDLIGPATFVAAALCLALWLVNRGERRRPRGGRPRPGIPEREAQVRMGLSGERRVAGVLARELPETYVLVNGLKLPRGAGDIDHLVIGPTGVFLLETKTMAGRIVCEPDGTWRRTRIGRAGTAYAAYIGDPAAQVRRNIFAMRECLRTRLPGLFRGRPLWIEGVVVFPHPRTELQAEHSRIPALLVDQVTSHICRHAPQRRLEPSEVEAVADVVLGVSQPSQLVRPRTARLSAQALVEVALVLPVVVSLVFGTIALSRYVQTETAVIAVAHEGARAAALANDPREAVARMRQRVTLVAPGLGLDPR
ncbi:MAG TPA: nuclease-related domain-containing protein, partial [Chloroflexota bacterium]